jgi:hypothetical protein
MRTTLLTLLVGAVLGAQTVPANFSGKWAIQGGGGRGGGRGGGQVLTLNQVGSAVSGEFGSGRGGGGGSTAPVNNEIYDGKVEGMTISFYVWRGNDRPAKTFYKGTLNAAGDEISFTVTGGPTRGGGQGFGPPAAPAAAAASSAPAAAPAPVIARRTK